MGLLGQCHLKIKNNDKYRKRFQFFLGLPLDISGTAGAGPLEDQNLKKVCAFESFGATIGLYAYCLPFRPFSVVRHCALSENLSNPRDETGTSL